MILIVGIAVLAAVVGLAIGLALCVAVVARRSGDALDAEYRNVLVPPALPDEPALTTRRFARDPSGRPIAAPRSDDSVVRHATVASG